MGAVSRGKMGVCGLVVLAGLASAAPAFGWTNDSFASNSQQHGTVKGGSQSYLGIDVRDVGDDQVASLKLKDTKGAEIIRVDHDGPAGKMGLRLHDVVLQMNGVTVESEEQLRRMLKECAPGKAVALVIGREGQTLSVSGAMADHVVIERQVWEQHFGSGALPGPQAPETAMPTGEVAPTAGTAYAASMPASRYSRSFLGTLLTSPTYTGVMVEVMRPQLASFFGVTSGAGLLVSSVEDNSPASMAGLKAGDVIVKANLRPMSSPSKWTKMIHESKGKPISVQVVRDRQEKTLTITPDVKHKASLVMPMREPDAVQVSCLMKL